MKRPDKNSGKLTTSHEIAEQVGYNKACSNWERWVSEEIGVAIKNIQHNLTKTGRFDEWSPVITELEAIYKRIKEQ